MAFFVLASALLSLLVVDLWLVIGGVYLFSRLKREKRLSQPTLAAIQSLVAVSFLLVLLNLNQVMGANVTFVVALAVSIVVLPYLARGISPIDRERVWQSLRLLAALQLILLLFLFLLFQVYKYWLLEGSNHDSIIYFEGMLWAAAKPLQVSGVCGEISSLFVGYDCSLFRRGTYTLSAWTQFFMPDYVGNGLWFTGVYASLFLWLAFQLVKQQFSAAYSRRNLFLFMVLLAVSTGWLGALINSNLATGLAAGALALVYSLAFVRPFLGKYLLLGLLVALTGHMYAEAIFYAGFVTFLIVLLDTFGVKMENPVRGFISRALTILVVLVIFGNYAIVEAFKSLLFISELDKQSDWRSWFIHEPIWKWLGAFVAGDLLGHKHISQTASVVAAIFVVVFAFWGLLRTRMAKAVIPLFVLSIVLVAVVELQGYQYGEHKILQLLGPSWMVYIFAGVLGLRTERVSSASSSTQSESFSQRLPVIAASVLVFFVAAIHFEYLVRGVEVLLKSRDIRTLDYGEQNVAATIRPGSVVVIDDSAFSLPDEPFFVSQYATLFVHRADARVVMPNLTDDRFRGGYYRDNLSDTLREHQRVNFVLQGKSASGRKSLFEYDGPRISYPKFDLIELSNSAPGAAVRGAGWFRCELEFCATTTSFDVEVVANSPAILRMHIEYDLNQSGWLGVLVNSDQVQKFSLADREIYIELPQGYSRVRFFHDYGAQGASKSDLDTDQPFARVFSIRLEFQE